MTTRTPRTHGVTRADRDAARAKRTRKRRVAFFKTLVVGAPTQAERLSRACDYLRATAAELPDERVRRLAAQVADLAAQAERDLELEKVGVRCDGQ